MLSQFCVSKLENGRVCFQTPMINYTFTKEEWKKIKEKINEV